jgi:hypothetical protein
VKSLPIPSVRLRAAHLLALSAFAIAQPMFSLLTKQPFHLAIEGFRAIDVVVYSLALLLVPPAILLAVETIVGLLHTRALAVVHAVFIGLLACLVLFRALRGLPIDYKTFGAGLGALMFVRLYRSWEPARLFLTICSLAAVFFLAVFLIRAPLRQLSISDVQAANVPPIGSRTPVVLVIFDEFPESSLMNAAGVIDRVRYPNFAALARTSTWYRNATTVHDFTFWAVPAILTGQIPQNDQLPLMANHPENLFTLLGNSYRINASEPITRLCPERLCPNPSEGLGARMSKLTRHLIGFFKRGLFLWSGFHETVPDWNNPPAQISRFVAKIHSRPDRQLDVIHVVLPHGPWRYLPSGRKYKGGDSLAGAVAGRWGSSARLVDRAYGRHLLQVGFVDGLLGKIVARLRATGVWNRSLFIVTADHGVSFRPGAEERKVEAKNLADVAFVPLFVKRPFEREGLVDDRSARTVDIVPTIVDLLHVKVSWKLDGHTLLSPNRPFPSRVVVQSITGDLVSAPWPVMRAGRAATVAQKARLFGPRVDLLKAVEQTGGLTQSGGAQGSP